MQKNQTLKNIVKFLKQWDYEFESDLEGEFIAGDWFMFNREKKGKKKIIALRFSLDASIPEVSILSQRLMRRFGEIEVRESYYLDDEELLLGEKAKKCFEVILRNRPLMEEENLSSDKANKTAPTPPRKETSKDLWKKLRNAKDGWQEIRHERE